MVVAAVEESSRAEDDRKREALQVVSAFKTPHYTFNASRRTYHLDTLARPLHGSAKHKIAMLRGRLAQVQQRLTRSSRFRRPVSAKAAKETAWVELSSIESLVTKEGERATVLGMLVPAGPGSATRWALEDLHSRVPVSLEECQRMPGLYTESSILLAQGQMDDEGVFHVWHAGMPPPESRTDSLVALGVVDQYQVRATTFVCHKGRGKGVGESHHLLRRPGWPVRALSHSCRAGLADPPYPCRVGGCKRAGGARHGRVIQRLL